MAVTIRQEDERTIYVNDKLVRMDTDGNWVTPHDELKPSETAMLQEYLNAQKLDMKNRLN